MKILGISVALILLLGLVVAPVGFLSAFAEKPTTTPNHMKHSNSVTFANMKRNHATGTLQFNGASSLTSIHDVTLEKVTGGGKIGKDVNFGFDVKADSDKKKIRGNIEYNDKNSKIKLHSNNMTSLSIDSTLIHASFSGNGKINGTSGFKFIVSITDTDKTGKNDMLSIKITDSSGKTIYQNSGQVQGHIEIHASHNDNDDDHKVTQANEKNDDEKVKSNLSAKNNSENNSHGKNNHKTGKKDN